MSACPFCKRGAFEERLILESPNFAVVPTKGQIVEGYVLIVPKRHVICFGDLTDQEMDEAVFLMERVRAALTAVYGLPTIFFEHGIVGQTVRHAHMHAVPTSVDLLARIAADHRDYRRISTLAGLQDVFQQEGIYLYYENGDGEKHVFSVFNQPQYLRLVLAEVVGHPERGDWKQMDPMLDARMMLDTQARLIDRLK